MRAYLDVRVTLELKALDLARPRIAKDEVRRMLAGNTPEGGSGAPRLDNQLHQYFIEKSGNRYLRDFFRQYGGYYTALFDYATLGAEVVADMAAQHREILGHVLAGHWAKARAELAHHIRAQEPVLRRMRARLEERDK